VWQSQAPAGTSKFTGVAGCAALAQPRLCCSWSLPAGDGGQHHSASRQHPSFSLHLFCIALGSGAQRCQPLSHEKVIGVTARREGAFRPYRFGNAVRRKLEPEALPV